MSLNFPANPTNGDTYTSGSITYIYQDPPGKWTASTQVNLDTRYVNSSGDTMTGALNVPAAATGTEVPQVQEVLTLASGGTVAADVTATNLVSQGNVQTTSLNSGQLAGFRNQLINGDFRHWQRGSDFTLSSDEVYTADRWWTGSTTTRIRRNTANMFAGFRNSLEIQGPAGAVIRQPIELSLAGFDDRFTVGKTYTLSFYCNKSGTTVQGTFANTPQTGSGLFDNEAITPVPGETDRYSYTFTIGSAIGSTNTCLNIGIKKSDADPLFIGGVQLEPGPIATPFEHRPIGTELALCQRYYQENSGLAYIVEGNAAAVNAYTQIATIITPMRVLPTATLNTATTSNVTTFGLTVSTNDFIVFHARAANVGRYYMQVSSYTLDAEL